MTEPDRARELQRFFFPRERSQVLAVSLIVALVIPAWIPFDYLLEPLFWCAWACSGRRDARGDC